MIVLVALLSVAAVPYEALCGDGTTVFRELCGQLGVGDAQSQSPGLAKSSAGEPIMPSQRTKWTKT